LISDDDESYLDLCKCYTGYRICELDVTWRGLLSRGHGVHA